MKAPVRKRPETHPVLFRLRVDLRAKLQAAADENMRPLAAELNWRLAKSFEPERKVAEAAK